ncbi:MAG: hypothetical protein MZV70_67920 [Desulfobacterales bacterium]|nr:hypothetical protein [Desulfobacterales bacterium]
MRKYPPIYKGTPYSPGTNAEARQAGPRDSQGPGGPGVPASGPELRKESRGRASRPLGPVPQGTPDADPGEGSAVPVHGPESVELVQGPVGGYGRAAGCQKEAQLIVPESLPEVPYGGGQSGSRNLGRPVISGACPGQRIGLPDPAKRQGGGRPQGGGQYRCGQGGPGAHLRRGAPRPPGTGPPQAWRRRSRYPRPCRRRIRAPGPEGSRRAGPAGPRAEGLWAPQRANPTAAAARGGFSSRFPFVVVSQP